LPANVVVVIRDTVFCCAVVVVVVNAASARKVLFRYCPYSPTSLKNRRLASRRTRTLCGHYV